jgi:hypothetical protein
VSFRRQATWLGLVGKSRAMRDAAELNPRVYERWQPHYISREFNLATRARASSRANFRSGCARVC